MATGMYTWLNSVSASSNGTIDARINFAEGQSPSSVNDSARMLMGELADWRDDISGDLTTAGTSTAYTVSTNQIFTSLAVLNKNVITIVPHATCGASPTLAVDGLTAQQIRTATGVNVGAGALVAGTPYQVIYFSATTEFILMNYTAPVFSSAVAITGTLAVSDTITVTGTSAGFTGLEIISTEAAAAAGPILSLYRNSASPAASDVIGQIILAGKDSGDNKTTYAYIQSVITDPTNGSEDADIYLVTSIAGALTTVLRSSGAQIQVPGTLAVTGNITAANVSAGSFTSQYLTSGTGTYTTPAGCRAIRIKGIGGGGGGGGSAGNGTAGGDTTFDATVGKGGSFGPGNSNAGSIGGTGGTGSADLRIQGGDGCGTPGGSQGGYGGVGPFGGGGRGGASSGGSVGKTSSGAGGGGGSNGGNAGSGGAAGEYFEKTIVSPSASYAYGIGAGGSGGSGTAGAAGGSGLIIVEEYY